MSGKRLSVVVTRRLPDVVETRLSELFNVRLREDDAPMTREELVAAVKGADILVPTVTDTIDAGLIAQAGDKLKLIANYGAGFDHIDIETARRRGILVTNTPGVLTDDTADMAQLARYAMQFCAIESCGKCTPCRVGCEKAVKLMEQDKWDQDLLEDLSSAMVDASICGLGQAAPNPIRLTMKHFPEEI